MTQEPNNPKSSISGRLNMAGWRKHYVAAMTADEEAWPQREPGSNLGRVFIILLLLHGFLIGAVVLYNVISPKTPPTTVASGKPEAAKNTPAPAKSAPAAATTAANPPAGTAPKPAPVNITPPTVLPHPEPRPSETGHYEVRSGDNVPGIAAALGISAEELIRLNNLDSTELYPGRKLTYPKRAAPPVARAIAVAPPAPTARAGAPETFKAITAPATAQPVKLKDSRAITSADTPPAPKSTASSADQPPALKALPKSETATAPTPKPKASSSESSKSSKTASKSDKSSKSETQSKSERSSKDTASRRSHVVGPKETLYSIARKYGVKVDALQKANGIKDPTTLREGMKLSIPSKN